MRVVEAINSRLQTNKTPEYELSMNDGLVDELEQLDTRDLTIEELNQTLARIKKRDT